MDRYMLLKWKGKLHTISQDSELHVMTCCTTNGQFFWWLFWASRISWVGSSLFQLILEASKRTDSRGRLRARVSSHVSSQFFDLVGKMGRFFYHGTKGTSHLSVVRIEFWSTSNLARAMHVWKIQHMILLHMYTCLKNYLQGIDK